MPDCEPIEVDDDDDLPVPFDIPVEGVNHAMTFPLDVSWDDFEWKISQKLDSLPSEIALSYKLASQTNAEMARALTSEEDLEDLMRRSKPFIDGTERCARGKEFRVQLFAKVVKKDEVAATQTKKVCIGLSGRHSVK